jgi:hypothetical protein
MRNLRTIKLLYTQGNLMKLTSVQANDLGQENREILTASDSLNYLKNFGEQFAVKQGLKNPVWTDCTPPTMGNNKLSNARYRFTLSISEKHYLVAEK